MKRERYNWHYVVFHSPEAIVRTSYPSKKDAREAADAMRKGIRREGLKHVTVYVEKIQTAKRSKHRSTR